MTTRAVEQVDGWDSTPFTGGYRGLHDLADEEFSGVVEVGGARLCMLGGTVVGVLDGAIDDFEDAQGTAYAAPSPALPLLVLMQDRSDEVRAQYYTEDTPISEVDRTLSDGGFSGYVELSENVLSGDYYVVFHAGQSMSVAWVGNSGQLLTGDEAFERADGEVGIYEVRPVDVDSIDIPEPADDPGTATGGAVSDSAADGSGADAAGGVASDASADTDADPDDATDAPLDEAGPAAGRNGDATAETTDEGDAADGTDAAADPDQGRETEGTADASDDAAGERSATDREGDDDAPGDADSRSVADASDDGEDEPADDGDDALGPERPRAGDERADADRSDTGATAGASPGGRESARADRTDRADDETGGPGGSDEADPSEPRAGRSGRSSGESRADAGAGKAPSDRRERSPDSGTVRTDDATAEPAGTGDGNGTATGQGGAVTGPDQLETRSIPSLDPARTGSQPEADEQSVVDAVAAEDPASSSSNREASAGSGAAGRAQSSARTAGGSRDSPGQRESADSADRTRNRGASGNRTDARDRADSRDRTDARDRDASSDPADSPDRGASSDRVEELEAELARRESKLEDVESRLEAAETERDDLRTERDDLQAERDDLQAERDDLQAELDDLRAERDDMESELEELRSQLETLESAHGVQTDAENPLSPKEALDATNLFVRYASKGEGTLEEAHEGSVGPSAVNENLGLEHHTQFDAAHTAVGGQAFDAFLRETIQFRFVSWLVRELLYEIRDTGKVATLQDLYDAIPRIDRAELNGSISAQFTEDGQERRSQESFDVVMRDRMGDPLVVANLNDSRQATTENMMSSLVTASTRVSESTDSLAAAFYVTSSFFEPEALETAAEATSGGLLSRDKRESFVKLSRKQGYHLCLVESREEQFHLAVPEL